MNMPNKLTLLRIILVPFFIGALYIDKAAPAFAGWKYFIADIIFSAAALTDFADGYLARKNHQITNFGKLMDPLADKLLVCSAFIFFVQLNITRAIPVIIIIAREFLVTSVRLIAIETGTVIAANNWGKAKTVTQMLSIIITMLLYFMTYAFGLIPLNASRVVAEILIYASTLITLISGFTYVWQNRKLFSDGV
ncbi:MAG: CDP-diacylglycerol--glycerol-3-phosphate 3-phosphatidyltransferase [Oscillospiraceae bacterium]|jgi:CDP-diacylglycerol--glycerol-3-phosphate 3-phosphatidyltransferase|nr:CDP-diacylglycerol--glycerol-3-phosphate 3-phosphatidyltransferase [Oscillospiraceae bacterium]